MSFESWLHEALDQRQQAGLRRFRRVARPVDATHAEVDGRVLVNFASNNYLGLSHHPRVIDAAVRAARACGTGSGASFLISGYGDVHAELEASLAALKQTESAVLLPSGWQVNQAAVGAIAAVATDRPLRFLIDKLAHASLLDAVRATTRPFRVFPHNHLPKLRRLLESAAPGELQVVVTEAVFSMDGDCADLPGLAQLKREHPFFLLLDDAHATGVVVSSTNIADVTIVTLSKALGCGGGAICASRLFCDAIVNFGRAFIYSTGLSPILAAAALEALRVLADEPQRRHRLLDHAGRVRTALADRWPYLRHHPHSPIIPLILGGEEATLAGAHRLLDAGLLVGAVRPPTVPRGAGRLRVSLCSEHAEDEIHALISACAQIDTPMAAP